jgi:protoporphyrinogen oxidase
MFELGSPNKIGDPPGAGAARVVLGAGPAGLTAALLLAERGEPVLVLEADEQVGGLARTVERDGYRFDLGGHRFFTKAAEVEALWRELLGEELLLRPRRSRIRWRGRFIEYPLRIGDLVRRVGALELVRSGGSYARARLGPDREAETFEAWVSARFGRRLYEHFFRSYTEKVWGVPTSEIRAEWAAQRIRQLSLGAAVRAALLGNGAGHHSLIDSFLYPRLGPGQMWEAMVERIEAAGGEVRTSTPVSGVELERGRVVAVEAGGERIRAEGVISSLPLRTLAAIASEAGEGVREAAAGLRYRDFLTVALILDGEPPFPDNWIYVHDPGVEVGRIQNFAAWSPDLVPEPGSCCLGLEYFCFEGDERWRSDDAELVALAERELDATGLLGGRRVRAGHVVRVPKAYPIYDEGYGGRIEVLRGWLEGIEGLQQIGRNGLHRYNNVDHSMLTAFAAVENLLDGAGRDIWAVNADSAYHEERRLDEQPYRRAPTTPALEGPGPLIDERRALQEIA